MHKLYPASSSVFSTPSQSVTSAVLTGPPSSCLARLLQAIRMTRVSLPRVFHNSYFRVVFNYRPSPVLEKDYSLVDHTHVYQSIFNNGATDWHFLPCHHIPDRRTVHPYLDLFKGSRLGFTRFYTGSNMANRTVASRIAKCPWGVLHPNA